MLSLKERMSRRELTLGSWITLGHPAIAEIMAGAGFDWLAVDMEHSAIGIEQAQRLIQVIELSGVAPLVRVGDNDPIIIKRVMDAGAHGVIVPMVNSRSDAERAVASAYYPPRGKRGVGLARAQGYGADFEGYRKRSTERTVVIVQVEHIDAVNNLEAILSTDSVDGFIVGPYDLSGSLGVPGQFDHPDVASALTRIREVSRSMKPVPGFHWVPSDAAGAVAKIKEGYLFVGYSLDILLLGDAARGGVAAISAGAGSLGKPAVK
jgi:2-keto-3-deoxy-L-rhamnonate aldolase RhmA